MSGERVLSPRAPVSVSRSQDSLPPPPPSISARNSVRSRPSEPQELRARLEVNIPSEASEGGPQDNLWRRSLASSASSSAPAPPPSYDMPQSSLQPPREALSSTDIFVDAGSERDEAIPEEPQQMPVSPQRESLKSEEEIAEEHIYQDLGWRAAKRYGRTIARCPLCCTCIGFVVVLVTIIVGVIVAPPDLETDFSAFMKTDVATSTSRDVFTYVLGLREEARRLSGRQLQWDGIPLYADYDVSVAYELKGDEEGGILDEKRLRKILQIEWKLRSLPGWRRLCSSVEDLWRDLCEPGLAFVNYAFPGLTIKHGDIVPTSMSFNGSGEAIVPLSTSTRLMDAMGIRSVLMPQEFDDSTAEDTRLLRSSYRFKSYCCTSLDPISVQRSITIEKKGEWEDFVSQELLPVLTEFQTDKKLPFNVYFTGTKFEGIQTWESLSKDLKLAIGSLVFILFYLFCHTRSILLAIASILIIMLSVPFTYVLFVLLAGTQTMSLASCLSVFLVAGLGSDVVFIYIDFWRESKQVFEHSEELRAAWTLRSAGIASLVTSATTAVSFFANLASVLKPLREFGFFMGLCVVVVWVLISTIFLPLCLLDDRHCGVCRPTLRLRSRNRPRNIPDAAHKSLHTLFFSWLARALYRFRYACVITPALCAIGMVVWAGLGAEVDTGVPNIFPAGHNLNAGKKVFANFKELSEIMPPDFPPTPTQKNICAEYEFNQDINSCALYWCEVSFGSTPTPRGQCQCFRNENGGTCSPGSQVEVVQRFVSSYDLSTTDHGGPLSDYIVASGIPVPPNSNQHSMMKNELAPIVLLEWESGDENLRHMSEIRTTAVRDTAGSCGWRDICFCSTYACQLPTFWSPAPNLNLGDGARRMEAELVEGNVPPSRRTYVEVVFGIEVDLDSPLMGEKDLKSSWRFMGSFEARQPWAQRNMRQMCQDISASLRVTISRCWMDDFYEYVTRLGHRFPVRVEQFDGFLADFNAVSLTGGFSSKDFMWMRDGTMKASYIGYQCDFDKNSGADKTMKFKEEWDSYLNNFNALASSYARGAWHTSAIWVQAEAQAELISSTVTTLLVVVLLAFMGMLLATRDCILSTCVVLSTLGVVAGLAWFITILMAWPVGPIEVIALIVFIGYAVTYSLHIAHEYGGPEALEQEAPSELPEAAAIRYKRVLFAMNSIACAAMGSAITTAGCSVFLLICSLTLFKKLGGVILVVTIMSIYAALVPLPAALLIFGPKFPGCRRMPTRQDIEAAFSEATASLNDPGALFGRSRKTPAVASGSGGGQGTPWTPSQEEDGRPQNEVPDTSGKQPARRSL